MRNKKTLEYLSYFLILLYGGIFFYLSRGLYGQEHLLSIAQTSHGLIPFVNFFEHHGPLLYFFFAPLYKLFSLDYFPIIIIFINCLSATYIIYFLLSLFSLRAWQRYLTALLFIIFWISLTGFSLMPEPYIFFLLILVFRVIQKIKPAHYILAGLLTGLIFLIKPNAAALLSISIIIWQILLYQKDIQLIIKNGALIFSGFLISLLPFILIYHSSLVSVYNWLFIYNRDVVLSLGKIWPPNTLSLFYLMLIGDISALIIIIRKAKYSNLLLPLISSALLIFLAYPRNDDYHLLPSLLGLFIGTIIIIDESRKLLKNNTKLNQLTILIFNLCFFSFLFSYLTGQIYTSYFNFITKPGIYSYNFSSDSRVIIYDRVKCQSIYIYPSSPMMYLRLPNLQKSYFLYPNWSWTFTPEIQKQILNDIKSKKIDCFIINADDNAKNIELENYIKQNFTQHEELIWNLRIYNHPLLWPFKISNQKTIQAQYLLLH
ncbi:MAG: hypothetical protein WCN88_00210 [Candidatus Falkowbacteria bacterium]